MRHQHKSAASQRSADNHGHVPARIRIDDTEDLYDLSVREAQPEFAILQGSRELVLGKQPVAVAIDAREDSGRVRPKAAPEKRLADLSEGAECPRVYRNAVVRRRRGEAQTEVGTLPSVRRRKHQVRGLSLVAKAGARQVARVVVADLGEDDLEAAGKLSKVDAVRGTRQARTTLDSSPPTAHLKL